MTTEQNKNDSQKSKENDIPKLAIPDSESTETPKKTDAPDNQTSPPNPQRPETKKCWQVRAYVFYDTIKSMRSAIGEKISIINSFTNRGKTPAYNCSHQSIIEVDTFIDEIKFNKLERKLLKDERFTIGAGQTMGAKYTSTFILTKEASDDIYTYKRKTVYVYTRFRYFDKFGTRHITNYCAFYNADSSTWILYKYNY